MTFLLLKIAPTADCGVACPASSMNKLAIDRSESVQRQLIESQENLQKSTTYRERFQAEIISWKQESEQAYAIRCFLCGTE